MGSGPVHIHAYARVCIFVRIDKCAGMRAGIRTDKRRDVRVGPAYPGVRVGACTDMCRDALLPRRRKQSRHQTKTTAPYDAGRALKKTIVRTNFCYAVLS